MPEPASLEQIEPVATALLGSPLTSLDAAELVLNRRVDAKEKMITQMIFGLNTPKDKFAMLLMEFEIEKSMKEKGMSDFGTKNPF
ncbi:hypothetical protein A2767_06910 [Candidatus Roizmanbacteria bacterium RIFCSPHIGHO2_01_FULL_35_10]|uniref:Uncharacterized protein n=1 Tax=Candidatus Roizmanbacteria bacterium RIFCSPLOWO2_01_FULL_35_13 TaxID=1802055 RepID=A0A1F7I7W1_9BACT|nr:MAG: hypothetical protein A2767_06910 [Candidatus Roizmanbacteria bacterium RIFCSPHIGHO2_01_FULL_35_10]OGK39362.1 MAG: hypothetical protein A3A74_05325 [Candidatus Roizmanbacteria bacterium RIFCSPLOWO2_01_FULL_35_13]